MPGWAGADEVRDTSLNDPHEVVMTPGPTVHPATIMDAVPNANPREASRSHQTEQFKGKSKAKLRGDR